MSMEDVMRERRDAEIERQSKRKTGMPSPFEVKVVGVSFTPHYPDNLHQLDEIINGARRRDREMMEFGPPMMNGEMAQYHAEGEWDAACQRLATGDYPATEPLAVVLVRNPDNEYDANAIEVHIPALGEMGFIGHLTRPIAARLAPEIDSGTQWAAAVVSVLIDPDHMDRPGISIECVRAPEQEQE